MTRRSGQVFFRRFLVLASILHAVSSAKKSQNAADYATKGIEVRNLWRPEPLSFASSMNTKSLPSLSTQRQSASQARIAQGPSFSKKDVILTDGTAAETISYIFVPEPGKTTASYTFSLESTNSDVLGPEDVSLGQIQQTAAGYNITGNLDFNKWTGSTRVSLKAVDKETKVTAKSPEASFNVLGISFFTEDSTGKRTLVGGPSNPLTLTSESIRKNQNVVLGIFIQYGDGTDSSKSLNQKYSIAGISVVPLSVEKQLSHDSATCSDTGNVFDGTEVALQVGCGYGFSENTVAGSYVGPKLGLRLNKNRNGTFDMRFEWPNVLLESTQDSVGYETILTVKITGEVNPIVQEIFPNGPFGSLGFDRVTLVIDNLPRSAATASLWAYDLSITFDSSSGKKSSSVLVPKSLVTHSNGSATLDFSLPAGVGSNLPWGLLVTKPTGETLQAVDETKPSYLFTFENLVRLKSISPSSASERGGTEVTLAGEFPGFNPANSGVYFSGIQIPRINVVSYSNTQIVFTVPAKIGQGFNVPVTVQIDGTSSNALAFVYIPLVKVASVNPAFGPLAGGNSVTLTGQFIGYNSSDSSLYYNNFAIDNGLISAVNDSTLVFNAPPKSLMGDNSVYSYNVTVRIKNEVSNKIVYRYQAPITISGASPTSGNEEGGTIVSLSGAFPNFDPTSGAAYIGGRQLNAVNILFHNDSLIQIRTPARTEIGSSYTHSISVVSLGIESNKVPFTYQSRSTSLSIIATGGNYNTNGALYEVGLCGNAYFRADISNGARSQNPVYAWTLIDTATNKSILENSTVIANKEILSLPYTIYPAKDTNYKLSLSVKTDYLVKEVQTSIILVQRNAHNIGVRIERRTNISPSNPNVTLTIPSIISLPACLNSQLKIDSTSITYKWEYRGKSYTFSYLNKTVPEDAVGPTLLGREFQIPQKDMSYGTFNLKLTAYFTAFNNIAGSSNIPLTIAPAPLVAQINGGEVTQRISEKLDFVMSGRKSRDPDVLSGDSNANLSYEWSCVSSNTKSFLANTTCSNSLLPSVSSPTFIISKAGLSSIQTRTSDTYVKYTLVVSKTSAVVNESPIQRRSKPVTSTLIISKVPDQKFESLTDISLTNNQSLSIPPQHVKYYEDLIIIPHSNTTETTWIFSLVSPPSESGLLKDPANLVPYPGFYALGFKDGRYKLGILANKLRPNTFYTFKISSFRVGYEPNEQTVSFQTVEQPVVTFGAITRTVGTTNDTFVVSAFTDYNSDFKFYFVATDEFGFESCVDGCQGSNVASFRIASAGSYKLRCDVFDSLGFTLLASATSGTNLTVTGSNISRTITDFASNAQSAYTAGDHAEYQQLGNDMVKYILSANGTADAKVSSQIVSNFTKNLAQISGNSVPNTVQSANFVRTAAALARLTPNLGITYDIETLYHLVNITVNSVSRTPKTAALQQITDLLEFYNLTPDLVLQTFSSGTSRTRLVYNEQKAANVKRVIWLDLYEGMKDQLVLISLKGALCGSTMDISTATRSKSGKALSKRYASQTASIISQTSINQAQAGGSFNPTQGQLNPSVFRMAKLCNPEQDSELFINPNTNSEIRLNVCKDIFKNSFRDLFFVVARTPDYIWLSGVRQIPTRTTGLVSVMALEILPNNVLREDPFESPDCFAVELPLMPEVISSQTQNSSFKAVRLGPKKDFSSTKQSLDSLYQENSDGVTGTLTKKKFKDGSISSDRVLIMASKGGVYTVKSLSFLSPFSLDGINRAILEVIGSLLIVVFLVGVVGVVGWVTAARASVGAEEAIPVEADFTYVERDVYGRGTAVHVFEDGAQLSPSVVESVPVSPLTPAMDEPGDSTLAPESPVLDAVQEESLAEPGKDALEDAPSSTAAPKVSESGETSL